MKRNNLIKLASALAIVTMLGLGLHSNAYALSATSTIDLLNETSPIFLATSIKVFLCISY